MTATPRVVDLSPAQPLYTTASGENVYPLGEIGKVNPGKWYIDDVLPMGGLVVVSGQSQHGKTLVATMLAMTMASTWPAASWCGFQRRYGPQKVLYVAGEGQSGLERRFEAWRQHYENDVWTYDWSNMNFVLHPLQLLEPGQLHKTTQGAEDLREITRKVKPKIVVLDTLATMFGGAEENSASDMTSFVDTLATLKKIDNEITVVALHHSRKGDDELRGSGSLKAAIDMQILCKAEVENGIYLHGFAELKKNKDGNGWPGKLYFERVAFEETIELEGEVVKRTGVTLQQTTETGRVEPPNRIRDDILAAVEEHNPTYTELNSLVEGQSAMIIEVRKQLEKEKVIRRNSDKRLEVVTGDEVERL